MGRLMGTEKRSRRWLCVLARGSFLVNVGQSGEDAGVEWSLGLFAGQLLLGMRWREKGKERGR